MWEILINSGSNFILIVMQIEVDEALQKKKLNLENITLDMYDIPPVDDIDYQDLLKFVKREFVFTKRWKIFQMNIEMIVQKKKIFMIK